MKTDAKWLKAIEATSAAFAAVDALSGSAKDELGNQAILSCRSDLGYVLKKLGNLALLAGTSQTAVETARKQNAA